MPQNLITRIKGTIDRVKKRWRELSESQRLSIIIAIFIPLCSALIGLMPPFIDNAIAVNNSHATETVAIKTTIVQTKTQEVIKTQTLYVTPSPTSDFRIFSDGCISKAWKEEVIGHIDNCMDLKQVGVIPVNGGLRIREFPVSATKKFLIITDINSNNISNIEFKVRINKFLAAYSQQRTSLFFGVASTKNKYHEGNYILIDRTLGGEGIISSHITNAVPVRVNFPSKYTNLQENQIIQIEFQFFEKTYETFINGKKDTEIPQNLIEISDPGFILGYTVPIYQGGLDVDIYDFKIKYR